MILAYRALPKFTTIIISSLVISIDFFVGKKYKI